MFLMSITSIVKYSRHINLRVQAFTSNDIDVFSFFLSCVSPALSSASDRTKIANCNLSTIVCSVRNM